MTIIDQIEAADAKKAQGNWVPACGGTETPFVTRTGLKVLYCYQPSTGHHAYLNCSTDLIMSNEEAQAALGNN